jgi:crotonobetainyl-CoA:carnitine CoA-transferase CaiB-like acyl-CoA transferase
VVDVSLLSSGMWTFSPAVVASQVHGVDAIPRFGHSQLPNPLVASYATSDGRSIYLAGIQTERHFENFCTAVDRRDLLEDRRFDSGAHRLEHASECIKVLDEIFAQRSLAEWTVVLEQLSTPWSIVQTPADAFRDPQVTANHMVTTVAGQTSSYPLVASPAQFDGVGTVLTPAPGHGEHTDQVLLGMGKEWDEIIRLKEAGAVL